eukprot:jgi/Bigna1/68909/fgenesh1_pg.7_\
MSGSRFRLEDLKSTPARIVKLPKTLWRQDSERYNRKYGLCGRIKSRYSPYVPQGLVSASNSRGSRKNISSSQCPHCFKTFRQPNIPAKCTPTLAFPCPHGKRNIAGGEKPYMCSKCRRRFIYPHAARKHLETHFQVAAIRRKEEYADNTTQFKCSECWRVFASKWVLDTHVRSNHANISNNMECTLCGDTNFTRWTDFFKHADRCARRNDSTMRETKNICPICRKSFRDAFGLEQHRAVHSFRRPFKCTKCNKAFKQLGHLTHHMHVHASEGKFRCPQCNKKLSSRQNFDSHFAVHLDKKSFCCPVCKEWFRAQSNVRMIR